MNAEHYDLLYLIPREDIDNAVVASRLRVLQEGFPADEQRILTICFDQHHRQRDPIVVFERCGHTTCRYRRKRNLVLHLLEAAWRSARLMRRHGVRVAFCREDVAVSVLWLARLLALRRMTIVQDMRGAHAAETALIGGSSVFVRFVRAIEWLGLKLADRVICVSEAMRAYVASAYGRRRNVVVIPNAVGWDEAALAASPVEDAPPLLAAATGPVLVYSGGVDPWQAIPETTRLFKAVQALRPEAHLLILTHQPDAMRPILAGCDLPLEAYSLHSAPWSEVPRWLKLADIALLVREPTEVNRVASPTKFPEYLACGLPVLITEGIGDFSALVRAESLGAVLPFDALSGSQESINATLAPILEPFLQAFDADRTAISARCRAVVARYTQAAMIAAYRRALG